ncbi:uncharacterized protein LOC110738475 [Chenopodium quinoa]|uniref:uncharacterized protein LOC110738475 n=1 Tax=Chenopodium quinoa TaxID=63459 RepID=UPI000B78A0D2|nr:uncharacterized protein LOC110738475 [Chenopodium quinoa]
MKFLFSYLIGRIKGIEHLGEIETPEKWRNVGLCHRILSCNCKQMGLGSNPRIHTRIIREQKLREVGKLEQDLVFGDAGTKEVIKILSMHTDLSCENKLRLLMVYAAIYPEKFEGDKGSQLMQAFDWLLSFPIPDHIHCNYSLRCFGLLPSATLNLLRCSIKLVCMMFTQRLYIASHPFLRCQISVH